MPDYCLTREIAGLDLEYRRAKNASSLYLFSVGRCYPVSRGSILMVCYCVTCGDAYDKGRSKSNLCPSCRQREARIRAAHNRKERESVLHDMGLVKVRGALGGVYWE